MPNYILKVEIELTEQEALRIQKMARERGVSPKQQAADMVKEMVKDYYDPEEFTGIYDLMQKTIYKGAQA